VAISLILLQYLKSYFGTLLTIRFCWHSGTPLGNSFLLAAAFKSQLLQSPITSFFLFSRILYFRQIAATVFTSISVTFKFSKSCWKFTLKHICKQTFLIFQGGKSLNFPYFLSWHFLYFFASILNMFSHSIKLGANWRLMP